MNFSNSSVLSSINNITYNWNVIFANILMPNTVFLSLNMFLGLLGNFFVIVVYSCRMKKRSENYFIPILAFFDLLASVTCSGSAISDNMEYVTYPSDFLCKFLLFAGFYLTGTSASLLLAIAIQRYLKICRPLAKQMTLRWRRISVGAIVIVNFLYFSPVLLIAKVSPITGNYNGITITGNSCLTGTGASPTVEKVYYILVFVIVIVNICLTVGFYAPIGCFLYKRAQRANSFHAAHQVDGTDEISIRERSTGSMSETKRLATEGKSPDNHHTHLSHAQSRFNAMLTTIIVVYVISYVPTCIVMLYCEIDQHNFWFSLSPLELQVFVGLQKALIINHIANPLIYGFFDLNFRAEVYNLFTLNCRSETVVVNRSSTRTTRPSHH